MVLEEIANNDSKIINLTWNNDGFLIEIELWNGKVVCIRCQNCIGIKEKACINTEIGDILEWNNSTFEEEIKKDIILGGGDGEEIKNFKDYVFFDSWNERIVLEVLSESILLDCGG